MVLGKEDGSACLRLPRASMIHINQDILTAPCVDVFYIIQSTFTAMDMLVSLRIGLKEKLLAFCGH